MIINGYKAFNSDMTNRYFKEFEVGGIYSVDGPLKFGTTGNGFHFCHNLEDTLKFFDCDNQVPLIAEVSSLSDILKNDDNEQEYFDMYVARKLRIDRVLEREEIINMFLKCSNIFRLERFIMFFKLNEFEKDLFKKTYINNERILNCIAYYQDNDKDIYNRQYIKK